ncbi:hypothetical protein [Hymenobacter volaticus]|uniref:DUF4760 domain-containing protein n=1 Tax=Hymenobacter volaticus TaxID=2932254 RepID=A0ABY4G238_9BACT|nr:hypothetical protein [Hymenobacter volaticus]UOQ64867.1 hypothetical protein MUN86_14990 [Hymenobacter volaticus]
MTIKQLFNYAIQYWVQIFALAGIPLALLKILLDRRSKRDELRYNGLVSIRNAEIRSYAQAVGLLFARVNYLTVVINDDHEELKRLLNSLLAVQEELMKSYVTLGFLLPQTDKNGLEAFNSTILKVSMEYIQIISSYLNNRISLATLDASFRELKPKMDKAAEEVDESSPLVEKMVRKHLGI